MAKNSWVNNSQANPCEVAIAPSAGDFLIGWGLSDGASNVLSVEAGWSFVGTVVSSVDGATLIVAWKIATGSETTFTVSGASVIAGVSSYDGLESTHQLDVLPVMGTSNVSGTTLNLSIAPITNGAILASVCAVDGTTTSAATFTWATTSGTTGAWTTPVTQNAGYLHVGEGDATQTTAGAFTTTCTTGGGGAAGGHLGALFALRVAGAGSGIFASGQWSGTTPLTIGPVSGDFLVGYVINDSNNLPSATPAGWSALGNCTTSYDGATFTVFYRFSDGTETSVAWTNNGIGGVLSYRGVNTTTPFDVTPVVQSSGASGVQDYDASITPTTNGCMLVHIRGCDDGSGATQYTFTTESGTTGTWIPNIPVNSSYFNVGTAYSSQTTAGAITARCHTNQTGGALAALIALRPVVSAPVYTGYTLGTRLTLMT
ncbi:hypothetical protein UFOVP276_133 [uncultured Caudovirales phage]|uniref:Uncharacterized protein n=1 Tax=uncultured Caudovirales phage TaxID=2100421 RepID=A0A6J5LQ91_9CAUD|nr:hypothetical protein UFOVP127_27 [uncultured Caudovirales phage]CAB4135177.1 hypothetical protein UFOVP276_133 [uncultured Caudovirales phage]